MTIFTFTSRSPKGAILVLPEGASSTEIKNIGEVRQYAENNALAWYRHINGKMRREIPNGSLYLITGYDRCPCWGVGAFSNPNEKCISLRFVESQAASWSEKYRWREDDVVGTTTTRSGPDNRETKTSNLNHCLFLRGYRISVGLKGANNPRAKTNLILDMAPKALKRGRDIPFGVKSRDRVSKHSPKHIPATTTIRKEHVLLQSASGRVYVS